MPDNPNNSDHSVEDNAGSQEILRLIRELGNRKARIREEAERILRSMGPTIVEPLLAASANETSARRSWRVGIGILTGLFIAVKIWRFFHGDFGTTDVAGFSVLLVFLLRPAVATARQRAIVRLLSGINDRRAIGPFLEALESFTHITDWEAQRIAGISVIRLLPQLRTSDAHLLNDKQRTHLRRALSGNDKPLILAILKALEQCGGTRDLPFVEKISSKDQQIIEAAKACLPFLLARAEQQKVSQTLLRASGMDSTTSVVLLRPAIGHESLEPQILLRAVSDGADDVQ